MKMSKKLMITGATMVAGLGGLASVGLVSAATTSTSGQSSIIDKIASKFNLNKDEVKAVFDEEHAAREAEMTAKADTELSQLVTDGKITAEQKDKIIAKRTELQKQREADRTAMESKTDAERKTAMEARKTELDKWASDNGIDTQYMRYVMGGGRGGHGHGGPGGDFKPSDSSTSTQAN